MIKCDGSESLLLKEMFELENWGPGKFYEEFKIIEDRGKVQRLYSRDQKAMNPEV